VTTDDPQLRLSLEAAERRFADGDAAGAYRALEAVRRASGTGSRLWAEAMADIAVVLHDAGEVADAHAYARHAVAAVPDLAEAREALAVCGDALGQPAAAPALNERILLVVELFHPSVGGTEMLAADLAVELTARGRPTEVLCYQHRDRIPGWRGITVHEALPAHAGEALHLLLGSGRFGAVIGISSPAGYPIRSVLGLPHPLRGIRSLVVPCVNEEGDRLVRGRIEDAEAYSRALLRVDAVGYSSRAGWDRRLLDDLGVPGTYLPNAVPEVDPTPGLRDALRIEPGTPIVLHAANFWPEKNHLGLLEAFRLAPDEARLVCIGGPAPGHGDLAHAIIASAAADERVTLLGGRSREEVAGAMLEADLLVLPSIAEATPLVLLEAMSRGLPWIASETCGSAPDLAGGLIVANGRLAEAISAALADRPWRERTGQAGRERYRAEYSWDAVAPLYLAALAA
jgi:glycosyltransferase involved in cell wall biosynthesis